ncbi:MAG TPA: hypothetical protein VHX86_14090 [Tepidisphaeraceae bacterium]|jgi:hypothetical protein|nr:hypothetical protein [Tepidisphaeraceae bacterium]
MKWFKRILLAVVVLIVVALIGIYFALNSIVRTEVQTQATASLGVPTSLASARLSLLGGKVQLNDLQVGSPPKFSAPNTFTLDSIGVEVHYGQLVGSPIHIQQITIDHPALVVEQSGASLNLKALMDQMPTTPKTSGGQPAQPIKLVIDELDLNNAQVTFMPGIPGLTNSIQVPIDSITLKNIGNADGNQNGAAIKDVVLQAATALAAKAADAAHLPPEVKVLLSGDLNDLSQQLGGDFDKQFQNLSGSLGKKLGGTVGNLINSNGGKGQSTIQQLLGSPNKNKGQ